MTIEEIENLIIEAQEAYRDNPSLDNLNELAALYQQYAAAGSN